MAPRNEEASGVPLLLSPRPKNNPSVSGAVFNVSTSIVGAGIMSIPATLKVLGVVPAFLLIILVAFLVDISVEFLLRFTYSGAAITYSGMMKESFGKLGSASVQISIMMTNLGCLIVYQIIIGDVLSGKGPEHLGILQEWFGVHWWNSRAVALFFILVFVMLPLVLYRRVGKHLPNGYQEFMINNVVSPALFHSLWLSSAVSVFLAILFVGICSVMAIMALARGETKTPRIVPDLDSNASFFKLFTAVPVIVTAFTFHFNVHPIVMEMGKPSAMISAVRISLVLCSAIYFGVGIFGYLLFGESIMDDVLVNFDQNSGSAVYSFLNDIVRLSYALHLMLVFPLLNFSLRVNLDELLFPNKPLLATDTKRFVSLTVVLLIFSYIAAIAIPSIWYFFQFVGSTAAVCLAFIFPGSIVLRDIHGISTRRDKIIASGMIFLAVVTSAIAISSNIYTLVGNSS